MRVLAIVQARMGSTRLPGKALADIKNKPLLWHVLMRARAIKMVDEVRLAIPKGDFYDLSPTASECGVDVFLGPEGDVLKRFELAARGSGADYIIRLTGDCPLLAPDVCSRVLQEATVAINTTSCEYVSNDTTISGYPDGTDCEVFSPEALRKALTYSKATTDREHVTLWMRRNLSTMTVHAPVREPYTEQKLSVDSEEDLERVRAVYRYLKDGRYDFNHTMVAYRTAKRLRRLT